MQNATTTTTTASSYNLQRRSVVSPAVFPHLLRLITNPNQKERYTRTRLLSCLCLVAIYNTCPSCFLNVGTKSSLSTTLLELLNDPGQSGDDAALCLSSLLAEKEDLQQLAYEANAVKTIVDILKSECELQPKRLQGLFQSLAELSSKLEDCRCTFLSLQVLLPSLSSLVLVFLYSYLISCICFRITSRSIKNLSAGLFTKDHVMLPLVQLLHDPSPSVLVHSRISLILGALSNILIELSKSMDANTRCSALRALRNLMFLADIKPKELFYSDVKAQGLACLISGKESSNPKPYDSSYMLSNNNKAKHIAPPSDPEPLVQEQALALLL
ncbi:unnamed protein product [Brassica napus]|uniref:(rape) hypothetical protein n=1 Tax=Brassica napus TaxID=3708 RepID=A0A816IVS0_BRANA|nr:unnamed protein product [Brassica napus]